LQSPLLQRFATADDIAAIHMTSGAFARK
jgi:hypothetical protein